MKSEFYHFKLILFIVSFASRVLVVAQGTDRLQAEIDSLKSKRAILQQELTILNEQIVKREKQLSEGQIKSIDKTLIIKSSLDVNVLDSASIAYGKRLFVIRKNQDFMLLTFNRDFYLAEYKGQRGYVYYPALEGITGVAEYKSFWTKYNLVKLQEEERTRNAEITSKRFIQLRDKFGYDEARKILGKQIWIGMTAEMATESIGSPNSVNETKLSSSVHEQWVYKDKYLYFEDGILSSWQKSR